MIRIAICDDVIAVGQNIEGLIIEFFNGDCQVEVFSNPEHLIKAPMNYDVVFLDIDMMPLDGIETARQIRRFDKKVKIIYVTGYREYAGKAFSVHAFGYVVKPVKKEEIWRQLDEVVAYQVESEREEEMEVWTEDGLERLKTNDIYYFEYSVRKILIHTRIGTFVTKGRIMDYAKKMERYGFAMPHKSFSVNLNYIKNIKGYDIYMMDGNKIPLSQKKSREFRGVHSVYLANRI